MNTNELKAEIVRNGLTISKLAENIGMSKTTLYRKVNGAVEFNQKEIVRIRKLLGLDDSKVIAIFFENEVA